MMRGCMHGIGARVRLRLRPHSRRRTAVCSTRQRSRGGCRCRRTSGSSRRSRPCATRCASATFWRSPRGRLGRHARARLCTHEHMRARAIAGVPTPTVVQTHAIGPTLWPAALSGSGIAQAMRPAAGGDSAYARCPEPPHPSTSAPGLGSPRPHLRCPKACTVWRASVAKDRAHRRRTHARERTPTH